MTRTFKDKRDKIKQTLENGPKANNGPKPKGNKGKIYVDAEFLSDPPERLKASEIVSPFTLPQRQQPDADKALKLMALLCDDCYEEYVLYLTFSTCSF